MIGGKGSPTFSNTYKQKTKQQQKAKQAAELMDRQSWNTFRIQCVVPK